MIEERLDRLCDKFFPHSGVWYDVCFKKPNSLSDNYYNDDYFPCHTRDIYWLSVKFEKKFHLFFISIDRIRKYMETSEKFKQLDMIMNKKLLNGKLIL